MKKTFLKEHGTISEMLELTNEPKWFYLAYRKGDFEKATYILKNDPEAASKALEQFFNEYHVSENIRKDVENYLKSNQNSHSTWQDFLHFLVQMLSLNIIAGAIFILAIFGGYKLGASFDLNQGMFPLFTIIGVLGGMVVGGLAGYLLIYKHTAAKKRKTETKTEKVATKTWPVIEADIHDVRKAIRVYSEKLPKGVYRTILVRDDNSIDFEPLAPYLGGTPSRKFYMSKETYDIFEENQREIAVTIDRVQKAVDMYVKEHKQYPMLPYDPLNRVNYYQLLQTKCLDSQPEIELYITDYDGLVTHIKPKKKSTGQ